MHELSATAPLPPPGKARPEPGLPAPRRHTLNPPGRCLLAPALLATALLLTGAPALADAAALLGGEALFTSGTRLGGEAPRATVASGNTVSASALPCATCHGAEGAGRAAEAGVAPPAITWSALSRASAARPAYDEPSALRAVVQGIGAGGRALDNVMPRYALSIEDGRNLVAFLRALDTRPLPGVEDSLVRIGLLLPPGRAGDAFATAFEAALAAAAPEGVFGRRPGVLRATVARPGDARAAAERLLAQSPLAIVSALPGEVAAAAAGAATAARVPVLNARATAAPPPLSFALLPGIVEEGAALLGGLPEPGRALVVAASPDQRRLADAIAARIAQVSDDEPRVVSPADLPVAAAEASGVLLLLAPPAALSAVQALRNGPLPVLLPGAAGGAEAPDLAQALGRPLRVGIGVPAGIGAGAPAERFAAGPARQSGLPGRLGHAAGEVVVEALRRAGRDVTRDRIAAVLGAPETFEPGSLPGLRLAGGARAGSVAVWTADIGGAGLIPPPAP